MKTIETSLAEYVEILADSLDNTKYTNDRAVYEKHLAVAARMFLAIRRDNGTEELRELVEQERRSFGWSYLSGEEGVKAEKAFNSFAKLVEGSSGAS